MESVFNCYHSGFGLYSFPYLLKMRIRKRDSHKFLCFEDVSLSFQVWLPYLGSCPGKFLFLFIAFPLSPPGRLCLILKLMPSLWGRYSDFGELVQRDQGLVVLQLMSPSRAVPFSWLRFIVMSFRFTSSKQDIGGLWLVHPASLCFLHVSACLEDSRLVTLRAALVRVFMLTVSMPGNSSQRPSTFPSLLKYDCTYLFS